MYIFKIKCTIRTGLYWMKNINVKCVDRIWIFDKKMTEITHKKISDDFNLVAAILTLKTWKKVKNQKKANILETIRKFCTFDHIIQKADKISEIFKKNFIKIGLTVWILEHFEVEKACCEAKNWILKRPYVENRQKFQKTQNSPLFYPFM
jgi:hypothetical protein